MRAYISDKIRNALGYNKHYSQHPAEPATKPSLDDKDGPKLNLGCGWDKREGFINIDLHARHAPDLVADATRLTEIEDNFAVHAVAQDILEHIHRDRCATALQEWNRVLQFGGYLEVRTTDVIGIVELMNEPERANPEGHAHLLQCMFGTQGYVGDFHLNGFTEISLRDAFERAGFEVVYIGRQDQWLLDVVGRKIRHAPPDVLFTSGTDAEFLTAAYQRFLARDPEAEGQSYWMDQLSQGTPREVIASILSASDEARERA